MALITLYWSLVFKALRWLAFHQMETDNAPYQFVLWLIRNDLDHIGGSWYVSCVWGLNPNKQDPSEGLFND